MKLTTKILLGGGALALVIAVLAVAVNNSLRARTRDEIALENTNVEAQPATPADLRIRAGENQIKLAPDKPDGYNLLASAYAQKARETSDFSFNKRAEEALEKSLAVAPENYGALKLRAKLLLTYHRFAEALAEAQRAQKLQPGDHDLYGALTDAYVELGDYERAIESAQTMVDLRPDAASYSRVSYLRSLTGDIQGAVQAMDVAVKAADPRDPEAAAWYRVHLGDELLNLGRAGAAEREYEKALVIFPDYPLALAAKGHALVRAGKLPEAVAFYERSQNRAPLPETIVALGDLYQKLGRIDDAKRQYELVEFVEKNSAASGTYSRQLAMFWADHDQKLDEALQIVERERSSRADIFTCDALAWVLFKNNRLDEAQKSIEEALRLGTPDAKIYYHAGMIYNEIGDRAKARKFLELALATNPAFDLVQADIARQTLQSLTGGVSQNEKRRS